MKKPLIIVTALLVCAFWSVSLAEAGQRKRFLSREFDGQNFGGKIYLEGSPQQIARFENWLESIAKVPKGHQTLESIWKSGHELIIRHSTYAVVSAGQTLAPMSENLINGKGESVTILFSAHIQNSGSHMVYNARGELIDFTAAQNLYHEMAHAMHMMKGSWCHFASEDQAIREENVFRRELALMQNTSVTERWRSNGVLISNVDDIFVMSEWFGPSPIKMPESPYADENVRQTATGTTNGIINRH